MSDDKWHEFFVTCAEFLGSGIEGRSWCSVTTFRRLADDAGYWTHGLPRPVDIAPTYIKDGGMWGQPFSYSELAHIIIPKTFTWERFEEGVGLQYGQETQQLELLSKALNSKGINHRLTDFVLEIKLY